MIIIRPASAGHLKKLTHGLGLLDMSMKIPNPELPDRGVSSLGWARNLACEPGVLKSLA